jgi:hypothetical protein
MKSGVKDVRDVISVEGDKYATLASIPDSVLVTRFNSETKKNSKFRVLPDGRCYRMMKGGKWKRLTPVFNKSNGMYIYNICRSTVACHIFVGEALLEAPQEEDGLRINFIEPEKYWDFSISNIHYSRKPMSASRKKRAELEKLSDSDLVELCTQSLALMTVDSTTVASLSISVILSRLKGRLAKQTRGQLYESIQESERSNQAP